MSLFPADDQRLRELLLHLCHECADWEDFEAALLERLLFQADFLHFRRYGFPLTGQTYRRGIRAPVPRTLARMLREMARDGELEILEIPMDDGWHIRRKPLAFREPDLRIFDGQEIALVDRVIRFYRQTWKSGEANPDLLTLPWELARSREEIPYHLALLGTVFRPASQEAHPQTLPLETEQAKGMRQLAHHSLILAL